MTTSVNIHQVKLKNRREMERTIPRGQLGWWHDVCPGQRLTPRDATAADVARCMLREGTSRNPADYFCELPANGSLVSKLAIAHITTYAVPVTGAAA